MYHRFGFHRTEHSPSILTPKGDSAIPSLATRLTEWLAQIARVAALRSLPGIASLEI
jgi:hypothetical protein